MALWSSRRTLLIVLGTDFSESKIVRKVEMFRLRLNMAARASRSTGCSRYVLILFHP
jgi:hypothetical protein